MFISNPGLRFIEPYVAGLSRDVVAKRLGLPPEKVIKLGSAENPFGASPKAIEAVIQAANRVDAYPEWSSRTLRDRLAEEHGLSPDQFTIGAGATELMTIIIRVFAAPGNGILMYEPAFPLYHQFAEADGRVPHFVPMGDLFEPDIDALIAAITGDVRVIFLTSPHSPTGQFIHSQDVERICLAAGDAVVILDEAYIHFADFPGGLNLLRKYENLIVLRTCSKVYGLAGLRVGYAVSSPDNAALLQRAKPTWNVSHLQIAGALAALDDREHFQKTVETNTAMRRYVADELGALNAFRVIPNSQANFFLLRILDPALTSTGVFERLLVSAIITKDCSNSFRGLGDRHLRIDVSLRPHMDALIDALAQVC